MKEQKKQNPLSGIAALCAGLLLFGSAEFARAEAPLVVTDIAPIHSLVSMVAGDNAELVQLIPGQRSPHGFSLKPSQRSALAKADLVVIVSNSFSPSLSRQLNADGESSIKLALGDSVDGSHAEEDQHYWLDPNYAIKWLDLIAESLSGIDAPNAETYKQNAQAGKQFIGSMYQSQKQKLKPYGSNEFVVHHDAYSRFANAYLLAQPKAITVSDARAPSARQIKNIQQLLGSDTCVFAEAQHNDAIVNTVSMVAGVERGMLDPLGSELTAGADLYPMLMDNLVDSFADCFARIAQKQ